MKRNKTQRKPQHAAFILVHWKSVFTIYW